MSWSKPVPNIIHISAWGLFSVRPFGDIRLAAEYAEKSLEFVMDVSRGQHFR